VSAATDLGKLRAWTKVPKPRFMGANHIELLQGGDELFPRMDAAMAAAQIWLATYIFHYDPAAVAIADALKAAAARGVGVHVVIDGFGSIATLPRVRKLFEGSAVKLEVFRPLDRWYAWLQPGQLRRLHQKLCVCDGATAFVGGVNLIDDRHDMNHGWTDVPHGLRGGHHRPAGRGRARHRPRDVGTRPPVARLARRGAPAGAQRATDG
jgi:cardiolipin synthase A/B